MAFIPKLKSVTAFIVVTVPCITPLPVPMSVLKVNSCGIEPLYKVYAGLPVALICNEVKLSLKTYPRFCSVVVNTGFGFTLNPFTLIATVPSELTVYKLDTPVANPIKVTLSSVELT